VREAMAAYRCSEPTVRRWLQQGLVKAVWYRRHVYIRRADVRQVDAIRPYVVKRPLASWKEGARRGRCSTQRPDVGARASPAWPSGSRLAHVRSAVKDGRKAGEAEPLSGAGAEQRKPTCGGGACLAAPHARQAPSPADRRGTVRTQSGRAERHRFASLARHPPFRDSGHSCWRRSRSARPTAGASVDRRKVRRAAEVAPGSPPG
jgi:hypothetical protein